MTTAVRRPRAGATPLLRLGVGSVTTVRGHRVGRVVAMNDACWLIDYPDNPHPPLIARTTLRLDQGVAERIAVEQAEVLIVFEEERSDRPVVIGLVSDTPVRASQADEDERVATRNLEATVDGQRVVVTAEEEIVLRCGEASVTLRRNGRVVVRGTYIETRSKGVNRIKGGSVQIN